MREMEKRDLVRVAGGKDASECAADATNGFGIGAAVGGAIGAAAGPAGAAIGAMGGGLAVGAMAVSDNEACGTSNGDSGGAKVICTELCRNGLIEHDVWLADIRYSRENFSECTMRGYHLWGIPYVRLMRKYPLVAKVAERPTRWFAEDIAYRMGVRPQGDWKGWMLREVFFRPLCSALGLFAKARNWQALWADGKAAA